jgi:hypothetical protein
MSKERLDDFSKILVATSAINYMAASINGVNEQIKFIPDPEGIHKDGIEARRTILFETWGKLGEIMEELGNLINDQDCICPIDERITKEAFNIIIRNKDDVNR